MRRAWIEDVPEVWQFQPVSDPDEADKLLSEVWELYPPVVKITAMRKVGGHLWLHVQVRADSDCIRSLADIADPPIVLAEGWLQAHDPSGEPLVWFETYCD